MRLIIGCLIICFVSGCVSLETIQTGRSLGKGNHSVSGALGYGSGENLDYPSFGENGNYFLGQARYMYGARENLDMGLTINLSSFLILNSKYQIIGIKESFFASSIGIDVGATPVTLMHAATLGYMSSIRSYNSFHLGKKFGLTFSPGYIFLGRSQFSEGYGGSYHKANNYLGYSFSLFFGSKKKIVS